MLDVSQFELNFNKRKDLAEPEQLLKRLEFERNRIFKPADGDELLITPGVHHADFYTILLRRLFRWLDTISKTDQRVLSLTASDKDLLHKIWIRDDFDHGIDKIETFPATDSTLLPEGTISSDTPIKIVTSVMIGKTTADAVIVSGNVLWDLKRDHTRFVGIIETIFSLYPFGQLPASEV